MVRCDGASTTMRNNPSAIWNCFDWTPGANTCGNMQGQPWPIRNWKLWLFSCIRVRAVPRYLTISESKDEVANGSPKPIKESARNLPRAEDGRAHGRCPIRLDTTHHLT